MRGLGEYLAERGYVVAMAYHYRANTLNSSALYVRDRLWRRPLDLSLIITHLLQDPVLGTAGSTPPASASLAIHKALHGALDRRGPRS